jgi:hypothetical protein
MNAAERPVAAVIVTDLMQRASPSQRGELRSTLAQAGSWSSVSGTAPGGGRRGGARRLGNDPPRAGILEQPTAVVAPLTR